MEWLNYHHLLYFWTVARTGSVTAAALELNLSPATVSEQVHELESRLDEKLLRRSGRQLLVTDAGALVFRYASEIFALGREMLHTVHDGAGRGPLQLAVGVADALPSLMAEWLIEPAFHLDRPLHLVCREAATEQLLVKLAMQEVDIVLSDTPGKSSRIRAYNHLLAECGVVFMGTAAQADAYRKGFPKSLNGAPMLLPTDNIAIRAGLEQWMDGRGIRPQVIGECEDYSLLRAFGEAGLGMYPAPSILQKRIERLFGLRRIGGTDAVRYRYYAISGEKKAAHPAVSAIWNGTRRSLFA